MSDMSVLKRVEFRLVARRAIRKAFRTGKISRQKAGKAIRALADPDNVEDAALACLSQAVDCGVLTEADASNRQTNWAKMEADVDPEKWLQFFLMILPMFL